MLKKQIIVGISTLIMVTGLGFWIAKNTQKPNDSQSREVAGVQDAKSQTQQASSTTDPAPIKPELYIPELETTNTPVQTSYNTVNNPVSSDNKNSFDDNAKSTLQYTLQNSITRTADTTTKPKEENKSTADLDQIDKTKISIIHTPENLQPAPQPTENEVKTIVSPIQNKKISSNIDSQLSSVPINQSLQFTFENPVTEEFTSLLKFSPPMEFNRIINGKTLAISPLQRFAKSTVYSFGINANGVCAFSSNICQQTDINAFKVTFTTDFKESFSFGKSVEGRDLLAYKFGQCKDEKCKKVLLTGGLHGSEWKSGDLTSFKDWLSKNPSEIVNKNKEFLIVPFANPDGTAKNQRYNANGVNLNRNFPINWVSCDVCGKNAVSEPETKALVDLTNNFKPNFTISYHAQWPKDGIIFRGDDNNPSTQNFAKWVSDRSGYPVGVFSDNNVTTTNSVPGDQIVWGESTGSRGIIIESTDINSTDWEKNVNVYLSLLRENY